MGSTWLEGAGLCCHYRDRVDAPVGLTVASRERCERQVVPGLMPSILVLGVETIELASFPVGLTRNDLDPATTGKLGRIPCRAAEVTAHVLAWPKRPNDRPSPAALAGANTVRTRLLAHGFSSERVTVVASDAPGALLWRQCARPEGEDYELSICAQWSGPPRVHEEAMPGATFSVTLPRTADEWELELCKNRRCSGARVVLPRSRAGPGEPSMLGHLAGGLVAVFLVEPRMSDLRLAVRAPVETLDDNRPGDDFVLRVVDADRGQPRCERSWSAIYQNGVMFKAELACYQAPAEPSRFCPRL